MRIDARARKPRTSAGAAWRPRLRPHSPRAAGRAARARDGQRGFSLLEILVAFAILAVSLGVLMSIFARAADIGVRSSQYSRAVSLAESRLALVGATIPLEEGQVSGEPEDGFDWELGILALETADDPLEQVPFVPYQVNATVLWRDGDRARRVTLSTLRLGARP